MKFGQNQNRFNQAQNRFNNRGRGQSQNFGQRRNGQQLGQNRNRFNNREVFCTFCKKYRHQVGNCIALKAELRKRGDSWWNKWWIQWYKWTKEWTDARKKWI